MLRTDRCHGRKTALESKWHPVERGHAPPQGMNPHRGSGRVPLRKQNLARRGWSLFDHTQSVSQMSPQMLPQREEGLPFSRLEKEPRQLTEPEQIPPQLPGRPVRLLSERPQHGPASRGTSGPSHWTNHLHPQESVGTARVPFAPQLERLGYSFALAVLVKPAPLFQKTVRGQTALPGSY